MKVQVENLSYCYEASEVLNDVNLTVSKGSLVGIIGPNGSGKSTLLKNIYRSLKASSGAVLIDQENIQNLSFKQSAKKMAVVGQEQEMPFDFQVREIVAMGRYVHKKIFETETSEDRGIVDDALKKIGIQELANKNYMHLSGGEKQRVLIARAIAQQSELIVLDEPTNHLDIHYQLEIFSLLKKLGVTVISAIHDLNLAAMYCDQIVTIKSGEIVASGTVTEVLTVPLLQEVFQVKAEINYYHSQRPVIIYLPQS